MRRWSNNGSSGISPRFAPWRKRSVLSCFLPMRAACDLTFMPGRPGGYAGKPLLSATHWQTLSSQYAVCDLGQRRTAVHDLAEAALSAALFIEFLRRLITNYPKKISFSSSTDCPHTRPKSGASLRAPGERPPPTVLSPAVLAGNQSGRTGLERRQEPRRCSNIDPRPQRFASRSEFKVATAAKKSGKVRAFFQMKRRVMQPLSS